MHERSSSVTPPRHAHHPIQCCPWRDDPRPRPREGGSSSPQRLLARPHPVSPLLAARGKPAPATEVRGERRTSAVEGAICLAPPPEGCARGGAGLSNAGWADARTPRRNHPTETGVGGWVGGGPAGGGGCKPPPSAGGVAGPAAGSSSRARRSAAAPPAGKGGGGGGGGNVGSSTTEKTGVCTGGVCCAPPSGRGRGRRRRDGPGRGSRASRDAGSKPPRTASQLRSRPSPAPAGSRQRRPVSSSQPCPQQAAGKKERLAAAGEAA
jgi:hypothetical protein